MNNENEVNVTKHEITLLSHIKQSRVNGNITEIKLDDIESIELNLTRPFFDHGPVWGPGEDYLYAFIRLNSGEEFIITSLLLAKLKFPESFLGKSTKIQRLRAWPK